MKICFPVQEDSGMESSVYNHFGSAPLFVVFDTLTKTAETFSNQDQQHAKGFCSPVKALNDKGVDAVIVGGIGAGALGKLGQMGIKVYRSAPGSVRENLDMLQSSRLAEYSAQSCCSAHREGPGCSH